MSKSTIWLVTVKFMGGSESCLVKAENSALAKAAVQGKYRFSSMHEEYEAENLGQLEEPMHIGHVIEYS